MRNRGGGGGEREREKAKGRSREGGGGGETPIKIYMKNMVRLVRPVVAASRISIGVCIHMYVSK